MNTKRSQILLFYLFAYSLFLSSCDNFNQRKYVKVDDPTFPYSLWTESETYQLNDELSEISGIHYMEDGLMACIEDENGLIYFYDLNSKSVVKKVKFAKSGDYEDIEIIDSVAYVIRSDGKLYEITNYLSDKPQVKKYDTPLNSKNDVEGMCYDKENNRLLLACKNDAGIEQELPGQRAVYSFNLDKMKLSKKPVFTVFLADLSEKAKTKVDFAPSGIEIHPISNEIYLISTVGKLMLILNKSGKFIKAKRFGVNNKFNQPEGITFSKSGTMFISNEARISQANILRFDPIPADISSN
ncbi:SdiA-regulated domain-containing protein [Flammeovirgaceae bacterium SG7u.111]|nr:SdiA-regulated domain-containing protein [Flammeovirgaceae bacterium SG7u.132]WPO33116.1 SdiA-regulated domain-containing protein [Flammeovirgaceae bacterium SG7u.111]